jgi:hypothetical protein
MDAELAGLLKLDDLRVSSLSRVGALCGDSGHKSTSDKGEQHGSKKRDIVRVEGTIDENAGLEGHGSECPELL